MSLRHATTVFALLGFLAFARAAEPDPEVVFAEKTLREAGIDTTGAGLLRYFRERTLTADEVRQLADAVKRLGDDDFDTREKAVAQLVRANRKALPFLRTAKEDRDAERARRAVQCIAQIESDAESTHLIAAARLLADRCPEGAAAVILAFLPGAQDETIEDPLLKALLRVGVKDGKPDTALVQAMADPEPLRRAAAAHVLGRLVSDRRDGVRKLLTDPAPRVRYEAAVALLQVREKESIPALIGLLDDGPLPIGWRAQEFLFRVAGDKAPSGTLTEDKLTRRTVADAWRGWWKDTGAKLDLAKIDLEETLRGITLLCEESVDGGRVWACRADGKPLWTIKGVTAWDAVLLPNGHVLIAEYTAQKVTERDQTGKILWSKAVTGIAGTVQRLPNGNTFIGTFNEILEVDPKGNTVFSYKHPSGGLMARAHRLRNGHLLFAVGGNQVVEVDEKLKEIRSIKVDGRGDSWISVEPLSGNRLLVAPYGASKAYEMDTAGKSLREFAAPQVMSAVRLPNGNTLVSCDRDHAVIEYDRAGAKVWELKTAGSVRCVRRY